MNKNRLWLLTIILIAFALRFYNLTYHSLWFDEAISVRWARQTTPRILEVGFNLVEDRLPPLYYLTLKGWTALFGFSETSVRSLSVFFGVLLIPVMANIAARLFNRRIAYFTALLTALNPFLIWYAQEARMYALAVLFSALTVWAFLGIIKSAQRPVSESTNNSHPWNFIIHYSSPVPAGALTIFFILFAAAGLYTHLYTGFLLPALGVWLMISYPRAWRTWLLFAISSLIITLAFTPLAIATWRFSGEAGPGDPFSNIGQRAWWLFQAFTLWKAPLSSVFQKAIPVTMIFFTLLAYLHRPNLNRSQLATRNWPPSNPLLLVSLLLVTPFIIANFLLLRNHLAFFGERYFIVMIPWLLLLAAVGAENLSNWITKQTSKWQIPTGHDVANSNIPHAHLGEASLWSYDHRESKAQVSRFMHHASCLISYTPHLLLLIATTLPLPGQWSIPAAKEAWRQSVAYLATHAEPDHGILIHPDWVRYPFQFYFQGPGQTYAAFSTVTPQTSLDGPLQGVVSNHPVIWLIQSHLDGPDPHHLVEQWFAARYPLVTELYPPGIILKGYAPGYQLDSLPPKAIPVDIQFENGMQLVGYQVDPLTSATDELFHPPSGWVHLILYWTATQPITQEATPFVHLIGPEGVWGASLERSNDALKLYPPSRWWPASEGKPFIRHDVDVNLNPATPPGIYQLVLGLRGYETQYPLGQTEVR